MTAEPGEDRPDGTSTSSRREVGGRDLPVAIVSGVLLATAFLGSLFWNAAALAVVAGSLVAVGVIESARVLREHNGIDLATPVILVAGAIAFVGAHQVGEGGILLGVVVLFLGAVFWELSNSERTNVVSNVSASLLFGLWVPINAAFAVLLVGGGEGPHTPEALLAVAGGVIFTDIGGFAFGVKFGKHKIAPTVSAAKSWEGLIGGLVTSGLLGGLVLPLISDYSVVSSVFVAVLGGLAGFFGDLVESMFKRDLGLKDLGDILPGHGGVLDRVDGLLLALPVGYYTLQVLGS